MLKTKNKFSIFHSPFSTRWQGQRGQIALVVLLVMIVMLTLGITVAQRGLFDVKLSEQEEESSRAFQAAETGVEEALRTLTGTGGQKVGLGTDTEYEVGVEEAGQNGLVTAEPVEVGETLEVDVTGSGGLNSVLVNFIDKGTENCDADGVAAVEVVAVRTSGVLTRRAYDVNSTRAGSNGFTVVGKGDFSFQDKTFCAQVNVAVPADTKEVRVRPFYASTTIGVQPQPNDVLAPQYRVISSRGETGSGVTRVVEVRRGNPQAASIFDYVLFSGNDLTKPYSGGGLPSPSPSPTPSPSPSPTPPPGGPWWDNAWRYRVPLLINNPASQVTRFRLDFGNAASAIGAWVEVDWVELSAPGAMRWEFNTNGNTEGWSLYDPNTSDSQLSVAGGVLRWHLDGSDSYVRAPSRTFTTSASQTVKVRYKIDFGGNPVTGQFYWITPQDGVWGANNKWGVFSHIADGAWHEVEIPVGQRWNVPILTDHQVLLTLESESTTDEIALIQAGKLQVDCDDIRVLDSDNATLLPHWLETNGGLINCYGGNGRVWIRVPSIPGGGKTVYLYYGNSAASSASSLPGTFDPIGATWNNNWKYSGDNGGKERDWQSEITRFNQNITGWTDVNIRTDYVSDCSQCHWFVRSRELFILKGEIRYSGRVDDDEVWTLISSWGEWYRIGGDEDDADGADAHSWSNRPFTQDPDDPFIPPKEGRYIWAGRGNEGQGGEALIISRIDVGLANIYTRKQVRPEPTVSMGMEQMRP